MKAGTCQVWACFTNTFCINSLTNLLVFSWPDPLCRHHAAIRQCADGRYCHLTIPQIIDSENCELGKYCPMTCSGPLHSTSQRLRLWLVKIWETGMMGVRGVLVPSASGRAEGLKTQTGHEVHQDGVAGCEGTNKPKMHRVILGVFWVLIVKRRDGQGR